MATGGPLYDLQGLQANPFASHYKYPPLFAGLIHPLGLLDFDTARTVWRAINIGFLALATGVLVATFSGHGAGLYRRGSDLISTLSTLATPAALGLLFFTLMSRPVIDALNYGQLDPLFLLLLTLCLAALRADKPGLAGPPLALAVALKLYPALLLPYLIMRREGRALGSFAISLAGLGVIGLAMSGPGAWATYFREVLPISGGTTAWVENQTFSGFVARLLTDDIALKPFAPGSPSEAALMRVVTYGMMAAVLAITLWAARRPAARDSTAYALGFGATVAAILPVLPAAWLHYAVALLLPLAAALWALQQEGAAWAISAPRRVMWSLALVAIGAVLITYGNVWLIYERVNLGGIWKLILSYKFYGELALWAGLLVLLRLASGPAGLSVAAQPSHAIVPERDGAAEAELPRHAEKR